jgi:F-type H+-transporting ATPase subunit delta
VKPADRTLAARYARALFQCACARGEETADAADLSACSAALAAALPLLRDPRVATADKKSLVRRGLPQGSLLADFLELLIDKKRFDLLPLVAGEFGQLILKKRGVARARVRTARPLAEADRRRLLERLEAFAGCGVELELCEDPELLGGLTVRLGDWVLDSSLRGQLQNLKEAIRGD